MKAENVHISKQWGSVLRRVLKDYLPDPFHTAHAQRDPSLDK